jgi:hypothetical protein
MVEKLVLELCLEYIGRRWRRSFNDPAREQENVVEEIGRKLTEVCFEVGRTADRG